MDDIEEYISAGYRYAYAYNYYLQARKDLREARAANDEAEIETLQDVVAFHREEMKECEREIVKLARMFTSDEADDDDEILDEEQ